VINPYRGEVAIEIAGRPRILRYGWAEIAALQAALGEDFSTRIAQAMAATDGNVLAQVLAIGLKHDWPEVTAEAIVEASPPIAATIEAINRALTLAFHGVKGVPDDPAARPTLAARMLAAISFWRPARAR
jgi:hypothetical protein